MQQNLLHHLILANQTLFIWRALLIMLLISANTAVADDSGNTAATVVVAPQISPNGGTHSGSVTVSLNATTAGATIRYSTNGADVTASSALYITPITLIRNTTIKAKAFKAGLIDSTQQAVSFVVQGNSQAVTYLHTDVLGSVVMETDANGNVKKRNEYLPFGESKDN